MHHIVAKKVFSFHIEVARVAIFLTLAITLASCRNNPPQDQTHFFESEVSDNDFFPRAKPEDVGISPAALSALVAEAQATRSHALIVIKDGYLVAKRYFGHDIKQPLRINSITKSVVSLSVGLLIKEGKIPGLDTPISKWYPEWSKGKKAKITLWNIMTHTSGLYHEQSAEKLYQQRDVIRYTAGLPVTDEPGKNFSYSNEAVALIPGIVQAASGKPLDIYLRDRLFKPMGISTYDWDRDPAGNVMAYGGLWLFPHDLARIGQLMADTGRWEGKQLIPASWIRTSISPARGNITWYGMLWWLYPSQEAQTPAATDIRTTTSGKMEGNNKTSTDYTGGFGADGWLGQYLVVYPKWHLVAVRMHAVEAGNDESENKKYGFQSFQRFTLALIQQGPDSLSDKTGTSVFNVEVH
jgi:CubicO group peptidase (beta-lactamase class C family)